MNDHFFERLIYRFLDGHATTHEKNMLAQWLREDHHHEELYYLILAKRERETPQAIADTEERLRHYEKFLYHGDAMPRSASADRHVAPHSARPVRNLVFWRAACVVLILMLTGIYSFHDIIRYETYASPEGELRSVVLADGSTVTLNANSSIRVPRPWFTGDDREVWVTGEAFFDITRKPNHQRFIVHTSNVKVQVLGTRFNVNHRRGNTQVTLEEGKVKLVSGEKEVIMQRPGEQIHVTAASGALEHKIVNPEEFKAWTENKLVFDHTPLSEVVRIIHDHYGTEVVLLDSAHRRRAFTGTLPNNDLDVMLRAIATAYNITIEKQNDRILLK